MLVDRADRVHVEERLLVQVAEPVRRPQPRRGVGDRPVHGASLELPAVGALVGGGHQGLRHVHAPLGQDVQAQGVIRDHLQAPRLLLEATLFQHCVHLLAVLHDQGRAGATGAIAEHQDQAVMHVTLQLLRGWGAQAPGGGGQEHASQVPDHDAAGDYDDGPTHRANSLVDHGHRHVARPAVFSAPIEPHLRRVLDAAQAVPKGSGEESVVHGSLHEPEGEAVPDGRVVGEEPQEGVARADLSLGLWLGVSGIEREGQGPLHGVADRDE
mmetsp:Transcript_24998/g.83464  ORF Transcript_24998/g.83464 Transcript_24998/m.83464 type:complete len:269 (-) Transcript_24998:1371-2177(-)